MYRERRHIRRGIGARQVGETSLFTVIAMALAAAGCCLIWWGLSSPPKAETAATCSHASAPAATSSRYETRKIRDIRTGHRVMADNPELAGQRIEQIDITPETWRNVVLQMTKEDGGLLDIILLRSSEWIDAHKAVAGGTIHLDLEKFGAVGPARVLSIDPCPPIEDGPGRIVTATFAHSSAEILDIHVEGLAEPIGTTANHPFWSEDRRAFVAAGQLRIGERLLLADGGHATVDSVSARQGTAPVYNLEVDGEHVYYVSAAGVLVHNTCPKTTLILGLEESVRKHVDEIGGYHLLDDPLFRQKLVASAKDNRSRIRVLVDGFEGSTVKSKVLNAAQKCEDAGGDFSAGFTRWEMYQLKLNDRLKDVNFYLDGVLQANPFK